MNLEVLDVSRNKLTYISGLENNFRMKRLYLNVRAPLTPEGSTEGVLRAAET